MIFQIIVCVWLFGIVSPLTLTILAHVIYFGIGLIILAIKNSNIFPLQMLQLGIFSLFLGFTFGYYIVTSISLKKEFTFFYINTSKVFLILPTTLWVFIIIGIFIYIYIFEIILHGFPIINPALRSISRGDIGDIAGIIFKSVILLCYNMWIYYKNKKFKILFIISFLLFFGINILLLSRHPILEILLMMMILQSLKKKISLFQFIKLIFLIIFLLVALGAFRIFIYNKEWASLVQIIYITIYKRLFMIGGETLYYIFNNWERDFGFCWGLTFIKRFYNLINPDKFPNLGYLIFEKVTGHYGGYDPVSLIGEMYINFGISGIVLGMWFVGVLFGVALRYCKIKIFNPFYRVSYAFISLILIRTFAYSLPGLSITIVEFLFILFLIYLVDNFLIKFAFLIKINIKYEKLLS